MTTSAEPKKPVIEGIKLIRHVGGGVDKPDDLTHPWRLTLKLRPPEFMDMTFVMLYGPQEIVVVRGMTKEALEQFAESNKFKTHPRFISLEIVEPEKVEAPCV